MKLTATRSKPIVSGFLIAASLTFAASAAMAATIHKATTHVAARTAPQVMYKDLVRPNGQPRSQVVYQADVNACYGQTGGNPYIPDSAAMKKCMLSRGYQFMWQRGFNRASVRTVASRSGSSDDDWVQQTLANNHQAEQLQEEQNTWTLQQQTNEDEQQSANMASEQASEMAASMAAEAAQNALAQDMANQAMMNNQ